MGAESEIRVFSAVDADTGWALPASRFIRKTPDGGATWTQAGPQFDYPPNGLSAVGSDIAWMASWTTVTDGVEGVIVKTTDGGQIWARQPIATNHLLMAIDAVDATTARAVGSGGVILKTTEGGDTKPDIVSVSPSGGTVGQEVTLKGADFGAPGADSYVSFSGVKATGYTAWSDKEIAAKVPAGASGKVLVTVTTPAGTSNGKEFKIAAAVSLTSITPSEGSQFGLFLDITDLAGAGFQAGATVRLEGPSSIIEASNVNVVSATQITCSVPLFGPEPGAYDVVVSNPDGGEVRLPGEFAVTSPCGSGSGAAALALGLTLGLLSLAAVGRGRRKRK